MYIYKITNTINNKCYIGQSIQTNNIRLNNHRYLLRVNRHSNPYLQSAWNFYGEGAFVFEKIKFAQSTDELDLLEKQLIQEHSSDNRQFGYNIFSGGHHQHGVPDEVRRKIGNANRGNTHTDEQKQKWAKEKRIYDYSTPILSPEGTSYVVNNVKEFSRENKLEIAAVRRVLQGKYYCTNGWRLITTPKELCDSSYTNFYRQSKLKGKQLISPNGVVYIIDKPLTVFCEEHNIRPSKIRQVLAGKQSHHRGWKRKEETLQIKEIINDQ
jgi:group I intron endonuclease